MSGYQKDFDGWNERKKKIEKDRHRPYFKEREIWWCSLGLNIGSEQDGKGDQFSRPVLVLVKFSESVFLGVPLTRSPKKGKHYFSFLASSGNRLIFVLSQIRLLDSQRLHERMYKISKTKHGLIREAVVKLIAPRPLSDDVHPFRGSA